MEKVPVTIITGFLGTGKTTLIKRICTEVMTRRIGVIQNEFSEVMGVEKPILLKSGASVYELPNGCLCCSSKSELVSALDSFLELSDRIDWIIIESAGTADPLTLTGNLWVDDNLDSRLRLDGVVSITDVNTLNLFLNKNANKSNSINNANANATSNENANKNTDDNAQTIMNNSSDGCFPNDCQELFETFSKQLSVADLIVVNKADISPLTNDLREYLLTINNCKVVESVKCDFDLNHIFDLGTFESKKILTLQPETETCHAHHEKSRLKSVSIRSNRVYSLKYINDTVSSLLWDRNDVYRCKGIFKAIGDCPVTDVVDAMDHTYELQGIGQFYEINRIDVEVDENIFLFIGNDLNADYLKKLI
ncbi:cobalamin synthesis protein [Theileria orientalis strain Shintoku]|uniref:Cobalamin synthesis protein n=1 Tax=Theileria orientalis strain Shintoku TaxID=869250 RepID=J4C8K9_THEOR|nr:cobalamin synthesis protein [Theileria orientalis strain Shintoku]PVC54619.1 cobalamin synthesis protein [Theileria orientalis]BAM40968.1 cobalamin synthesis protein [Theileria orientalis strain Shintoku]|eukprot:XP_009691269.1 cobalamin synthesis protein [Theileria orientalis strain Shintoku]